MYPAFVSDNARLALSFGQWANTNITMPDTADSSDNVPGASAISKGIKEGHSPENPGYWIHVSGTSILMWYDQEQKRFGEAPLPEQKYHDIKDIDQLLNLPDQAEHRNVDIMVQGSVSDAVKVAIVCPPTIYGRGAGTVTTRSSQVPGMARKTLKAGYAPIYGHGKTEWDHVHVDDLGELFVKLVDATQDPSKNGNPEIFGERGYFFANGGTHCWADVAKTVAEEAHKQGYIAKPETRLISEDEAVQRGEAATTCAKNSKGEGERAKKYLHWAPMGVPLQDALAEAVADEAKLLGMKPTTGN